MHAKNIAILTAGGLAPCLSAAIAELVDQYSARAPDAGILLYRDGYKGLLVGDRIRVPKDGHSEISVLRQHGGSPIGSSRVKLSNADDCRKRGLLKAGQDPLKVAAERLLHDEVDVLHPVGGDDTQTAAADLAAHLAQEGHRLIVVGLPKTIDNDIVPIRQSLGAWTAAEEGARFFRRIVAEHGANPRMLIVHEVMGRNCGWLAAATAREYLNLLDTATLSPELGLSRDRLDIHGLYLPEMLLDVAAEGDRLAAIMRRVGNVNLFVSEGAGIESILAERTARGETVPRDAFGHVKLDSLNAGKWIGELLARKIGAEKILVQKSGYFARSAPANVADLALIRKCCEEAVASALRGESGVIGQDEEQGDTLRAIEFPRIRGGKAFDVRQSWFTGMLRSVGQALVVSGSSAQSIPARASDLERHEVLVQRKPSIEQADVSSGRTQAGDIEGHKDDELGSQKRARAGEVPAPFFTIGYGGLKPNDLIQILKEHKIRSVVDVRLRPDRANMGAYTKAKTPDKGIEKLLNDAGIGYRSLIELGNPFVDAAEDWESRYRLLFDSAGTVLTDGLLRSCATGALPLPFALLCCEKDPQHCHRRIIADYLVRRMNWHAIHLRDSGTSEGNSDPPRP